MDRSKKTLFELIGGIVTLTLMELAIVTVLKNVMSNIWIDSTIGVWVSGIIGMVIGIGMALHMFYTINKALMCTKEDAEAVMRHGAILRMFVLFTIIVVSVCFFGKYIDLYILFLTIMNLKFAAYLVPLIDNWIIKRKVREC